MFMYIYKIFICFLASLISLIFLCIHNVISQQLAYENLFFTHLYQLHCIFMYLFMLFFCYSIIILIRVTALNIILLYSMKKNSTIIIERWSMVNYNMQIRKNENWISLKIGSYFGKIFKYFLLKNWIFFINY